MKRETKKPLDEQRRIVAYLDGLYPSGLLRDRQAKINALRELQSDIRAETLTIGIGSQI